MKHWKTLFPALFAAFALPALAAEVKYELRIQRDWSEDSHPVDWPGDGAHFSPGIGATHNGHFALFRQGAIATAGLETLSQKGKTSPFDSELAEAGRRGLIASSFTLGPVRAVDGTASATFTANDDYPAVSFAAMLAPSPDWFVGLSDFPLKRHGQWIDAETVTLYAWDSGTNGAATYTAPKVAQKPFLPIAVSSSRIFVRDGKKVPVATATIRRVQ